MPWCAERLRPDPRERDLADRGRRLAFLELQQRRAEVQDGAPQRDGAGGDDQHVDAARVQLGDILGERREPGMVEPPFGRGRPGARSRPSGRRGGTAARLGVVTDAIPLALSATGAGSAALRGVDHVEERLQHLLHALPEAAETTQRRLASRPASGARPAASASPRRAHRPSTARRSPACRRGRGHRPRAPARTVL